MHIISIPKQLSNDTDRRERRVMEIRQLVKVMVAVMLFIVLSYMCSVPITILLVIFWIIIILREKD